MRILLTGDRGYVGTVLSSILIEKEYDVVGYDIGYFADNLLTEEDHDYPKITKDIRDLEVIDLQGIDAVIHLAGLSNDPLGEFSPRLTQEINYQGTINLVEKAKQAGIKRIVYASSQSMYGVSETDDELDEDNSLKNPVSAYAIAKWDAEQKINQMSSDDLVITSFRPSTVFGASPRLRCDIVFNNLVACAYTTGKIEIMSDGSPWRPVVHVRDVCSAFIAGLEAPKSIISGRAFNVGILDGNYTVRDLAEAAQRSVPGSELTYTGEHGSDARTYKVSFKRILSDLKDYYKPEWSLDKGGEELVEFFRKVEFNEGQFRGAQCVRLEQLLSLQKNNLIDDNLRML